MARVVVEVAGLGFWVARLPMAVGSRGELSGGGAPAVVVRPVAEARWHGRAAGRTGLDPGGPTPTLEEMF